ncbi:hypothetical protein MXB_4610 [Myxobolus squamalis]|nr:hypothetical protein MXB_4610 [Myxobolus squamalis]
MAESLDDSCGDNTEFRNLETWNVKKIINAHREDVYDISWSPDSRYIITASVDNTTSILDAIKGSYLYNFRDAKHYVLGVSWDPLNEFLVSMSSDSTCRIYSPNSKKIVSSLRKVEFSLCDNLVQRKLYRDENLCSFFRRCSFSPDGKMLVTPSGISLQNETESTTFVFLRSCLFRLKAFF